MSPSLRMPVDRAEAKAVYERWDRLNGRYYIKADVRLSDGRLYTDVVFDGDSYVAVEVNRPELFGQQVLAFIVTKDCSPGRQFKVATADERDAYRQE